MQHFIVKIPYSVHGGFRPPLAHVRQGQRQGQGQGQGNGSDTGYNQGLEECRGLRLDL